MKADKVPHQHSDLIGSRVQREITGLKNVDLSVRRVLAVAFGLAQVKRVDRFSPDHEQAWLLLAHPCLPFRITVHIGSIFVEQVALGLGLFGPAEKMEFIDPEIGDITFHVRVRRG